MNLFLFFKVVKYTHCPTILTRCGDRMRSNGRSPFSLINSLPLPFSPQPSSPPSTPTHLSPNPNGLSPNPTFPPLPPKQNVLIGVVLCLGSTPASTTTALSAFFFVDFAFVFQANSVDFKIKLLSWKECAAQCLLHRCPWRFIHCRRRLVSH